MIKNVLKIGEKISKKFLENIFSKKIGKKCFEKVQEQIFHKKGEKFKKRFQNNKIK